MPYSRYGRYRYGRRKRFTGGRYKKYGTTRKRYGYFGKFGSHARSAYSMAKKALFFLNPEIKNQDLSATITPDNSAGSFVLLNGISQGDTRSTREGSSIKMISLNMNIKLTINGSASNTVVRIQIVQDKQPNGAIFTIANYFQDTTNLATSFQNMDYIKRFIRWHDQTVALNTDFPERLIKIRKKQIMHTTYNTGNAGTIADIATNSLYLLVTSDEATNTPTVIYWSRMRWIDN